MVLETGTVARTFAAAHSRAAMTGKAFFKAAADQIDHAIFDFQIIVVNGQRYFAFVKLNVNWWDPCTLYEYESGALRELCQWDNMRLLSVGLI